MPLTTLDTNTAFVIIDLQQGILSYPTVHPTEGIVRCASALAEEFRRRRLPVVPVVPVRVTGAPAGRTEQGRSRVALAPGWADLVPELNRQAKDHVVTKRTRSAFAGTDLEAHLRQNGVTQLVIAGISTSGGVESTARQAYDFGFNVTLAVDAMTDTSPEAHSNSITRIFPKLGETGTTREIIDLLGKAIA